MNNKLVNIERSEIDDQKIIGIIIDESEQLLLLQSVVDFRLDGLYVFDKADITNININRTREFQTKLLKKLGLYDNVSFTHSYDLTNWRCFFTSTLHQHQLLVIEEERESYPLYYIGKLKKVKKRHAKFLPFSGAARWDKQPTRIDYQDITCCQIGTNYINVYENYFRTQGCL